MYLEVVGGLRIYDIAIFIVSTPVVWIAGFRIYKGAYQSLRNRKINMDVLVTVRSPRRLDLWRLKRLLSYPLPQQAQATWK